MCEFMFDCWRDFKTFTPFFFEMRTHCLSTRGSLDPSGHNTTLEFTSAQFTLSFNDLLNSL